MPATVGLLKRKAYPLVLAASRRPLLAPVGDAASIRRKKCLSSHLAYREQCLSRALGWEGKPAYTVQWYG